jgi:hypothetical protein
MTKVFKSYFGRKYVIPAEYDIFIDFAPISYKVSGQSTLDEGKFQFLVKWVPEITDAYRSDDTVEVVNRLAPLPTPEDENTTPAVNENDKQYEPSDDAALPSVKDRVSAVDGEVMSDGKWDTWKEEEAFTVGGVEVTKEEAAVASTAIIIVIVGVVCICCFVSFLERKKISEEARRASAYAKRASQKVRRSIKSMRG